MIRCNKSRAAAQKLGQLSLDDILLNDDGTPGRIVSFSSEKILCETDEGERFFVARYPKPKPVWETVAEIGESVPEEEWAGVPADLAENSHYYLYGGAKDGR